MPPSGELPPAVVGQLGHDGDPLALPGPEYRSGPPDHQDHAGPDHLGGGHARALVGGLAPDLVGAHR